jgi:hypothetical protein
MSETTPTQPRRLGNVLVNHLGFNCGARKAVVVRGTAGGNFELRDMSAMNPAGMGERETYRTMLSGVLHRVDSALGTYCVGDFSSWSEPGIYQVVLPATGERSYQFAICDGAFGWLPGTFLRFIHNWRSGLFEGPMRGPSHMDDARRSDDGRMEDVAGGWYDAGDTRRWTVHSNLPALAFLHAHDSLPWQYADWERTDPGWSPWLLEARWGLDFMLKMQDRRTGMFYEDVAGGGDARKRKGMTWWYENHAGCYADNSENHFTDNREGSGDERTLRVQYNPIGQFTSVAILARAAQALGPLDAVRSRRCAEAAELGWRLGLHPDPACVEDPSLDFAGWTSVRSWRCIAALELHLGRRLAWADVAAAVEGVLENFHPSLGFWRNQAGGDEPYRGILHSAQPVIALCHVARATADAGLRARIVAVLRACMERYVFPLAAQSPFGILPFGAYRTPVGRGDLYRPWRDGYTFRFFMPEDSPMHINHGLGGHWTSWAHGLALASSVLEEPRCADLAWRQLDWLLGCNPFNSSLVSGVGFNNPMPHSRFLGTFPGGFCNGFMGAADDQPRLDLEGEAQWNTTEYWVTPLSNALMALCILDAPGKGPRARIGEKPAARRV